ncbi:uncharacterized protein LOC103518592 [Diaphorina citri]|uniref:Uncharacterized protein LOC103518592 n=1 Tax=Diaphorina citri TaxID=121845 RepID=A0A3Q0JCI4_DIACI|nr:uncharacterized protein LOC103518592 [Diaphorina citri]
MDDFVSKYILTETRTGYEVNLTVIIRNLSRPDLGEYKCYSSNGLGESESGFVKIHDVALKALILREKEDCGLHFSSKSKYILTETRTGYEVNLTVVIRNLSRQDLGEYKCYSSNGLGESESGFVKIHGEY